MELTPRRAAVRVNLGVAYEQLGDVAHALEHTALAVEIDPGRATAWVNLTRLLRDARGPVAAREVLAEARRRGVRDPRLRALERELGADDVAQGTTRR